VKDECRGQSLPTSQLAFFCNTIVLLVQIPDPIFELTVCDHRAAHVHRVELAGTSLSGRLSAHRDGCSVGRPGRHTPTDLSQRIGQPDLPRDRVECGTDRDWFRDAVLVMVVIMRFSRWRRRGVAQFNRLTMWRVEIGLAPGRLALIDLGGRRRAFQAKTAMRLKSRARRKSRACVRNDVDARNGHNRPAEAGYTIRQNQFSQEGYSDE
jgi:hypothetical protein